MYLTCIVGSTGEGKSEVAKSLSKRADTLCVWDVQNEYGLEEYSSNPKRFCMIPTKNTIKDFIKLTCNTKGYTFICEEMTGYFAKGQVPAEFINAMVAKRHSKNRFVLIFHSLNSIPPAVWTFCDVLIMFRTEDLERTVISKYPTLIDSWRSLQKSTARHPSPTGGDWTIGDHLVINKTNLIKQSKSKQNDSSKLS
jgi:hypothetical protein